MLCKFVDEGKGYECPTCGLRLPLGIRTAVAVCGSAPIASTAGSGTELKALLKDWLGIESSPTCSCNAMAHRMDTLGPEWSESEEGMAAILDVMRAEHAKRRAAGTTILPWTDLGARQLVLLACRRARANG
jgi:hypothetical protein